MRKPAREKESSANTIRQNSAILISQTRRDSVEEPRVFAKNLEAIREFNGQSIAEFAQEIGIAKSTLHSIRINGGVTLDTAIRISDGLNLPLDGLTGDDRISEKVSIMSQMAHPQLSHLMRKQEPARPYGYTSPCFGKGKRDRTADS